MQKSVTILHFTDREKERDTLKRFVASRAPLPVIMFYGVGGAGKSWLLKKLMEEFADERPSLPTALLDLEERSGGTAYHSNSSKALAYIRRQFNDVICPRFDLAYAWLRHREGDTEEPLLKGNGAAADAFEMVKEIVAGAAGVLGVGKAIKKIGDYFNKRVFKNSRLEKWFAEKTGQEEFLNSDPADPQHLYLELAERLMHDLAENLEAQGEYTCRAVVFLDTFEAVGQGLPSRTQRYEREAWVRNLHAINSPVLLVLAGRDRLTWGDADPGFDRKYTDRACLELHLVGGLSEPDSREFLGKCQITDNPLQDAILRASEDSELEPVNGKRGYHPFSLGLCANTVLNDVVAGRAVEPATFDMAPGDTTELARRFLKTLSDVEAEWVKRLALTPRFDETAALEAYRDVEGHISKTAWKRFLGYSFVRDTDDPGWRTLHAKMRDALSDGLMAADAHGFWREYWQDRSNSETDTAASLAWFHGWRLDPMSGLRDWKELAQRLRHESRMTEHLRVPEWWEPTGLLRQGPTSRDEVEMLNTIGIEVFYSSVGDRGENLRKAMGCYQAALRLATEATFPYEWAEAQTNLGNAYQFMPQSNLEEAFNCYQKALRVRTKAAFPQEWARTQNCLGWAYNCLPGGDRGQNLLEAIKCYQKALEVCTQETLPQDWAMTQTNLGVAYASLPGGAREQNLQRAIECYQAAISIFTELASRRRRATTQDCLGTAYRKLSSVADQAANLRKAIEYYEAALRDRTEADFPQDWAETSYNLGLTLVVLAEIAADRSHLPAALAAFQSAVRGYSAVGHTSVAQEVTKEAAKVRALLADQVGAPSAE